MKCFYTSTTSSSGTLLGDVSINTTVSEIKDLLLVDNTNGLQNVDYTYNVRGWLKQINDDANTDNDLFNFTMRYNNPTSGTALYNGNISQTAWNTLSTDTSTKSYDYNYDALNRITSATSSTGQHNLKLVEYDRNGNILKLQRSGFHDNGTFQEYMDHLTYTYSGNQLTDILEEGHHHAGFEDKSNTQTGDYTYDSNGNMIEDKNKDISSITYNHLNLPQTIYFDSLNESEIIYTYAADGTKLSKLVADEINLTSQLSATVTTTYYAGNYIYTRYNSGNDATELQFFNHPEGYVSPVDPSDLSQGFNYIYQYKDHLGNVRPLLCRF